MNRAINTWNPTRRIPGGAQTFGVRLVKDAGAIGRRSRRPDRACLRRSQDRRARIRRAVRRVSPLLPVRPHTAERTIDEVDESSPYWRKETVSFDAAYGGERVPAHLFMPRNGTPPYQTVVVFPARTRLNALEPIARLSRFDFLMRSGRAVLYPVYQGTYERRRGPTKGESAARLARAVGEGFLSFGRLSRERQDVDKERLGYYSLSLGAYFGPIPVALEPRIKAAIFASEARFNCAPEIQPANFAPHVKVPVLIVNGKNDFQSPPPPARLSSCSARPRNTRSSSCLKAVTSPMTSTASS